MAQLNRLEKKLESCLANKEYYEAHQIYRTLFYRLSGAEKYDDLFSLLESGVDRLVKVNEYGSGYDLAELYGETLIRSATPITQEKLETIEKFVRDLPAFEPEQAKGHDDKDRRIKFISHAVKWTQLVSTRPVDKYRGSAELHSRLGAVFWDQSSFDAARPHFMLSNQPEKFASFLCAHYKAAIREKKTDLSLEEWITHAVLQMLCLHRVVFSRRLLYSFSLPPYSSRLLNFSWILVNVVPSRNLSHFTSLVSHFRPDLSDECVSLVDQIGQHYFGVAPAAAHGGFINHIIKGLMGGGAEEDNKTAIVTSDDEEENTKELSTKSESCEKELLNILRADAPSMQVHDDDLD